jgi:4-hydroxybenzoate polyprenyltransferase
MKKYLELVKFSHTVFALPFALISMLIAAEGLPAWRVFGWILLAMVSARTMAMTFNRIADLDLDRQNPRAATRPTVTGEVPLPAAWALWGICSLLFFASAFMLNRVCLYLSPVVWVVLNGYSLSKRFTHWPHLFLGLALGLAPLGAWVAVTGSIDWQPIPLGLAVLFWVAGFDIIYALQDEEVDRKTGVRSLITGLGPRQALGVSRLFHLLCVLLLAVFGWAVELGVWYFAGVAIVALTLLVEQSLVSAEDRSRINAAFFTANGFVGLALLFATGLDVWLA